MNYSKLINIYIGREFDDNEIILESDLSEVINITKWNITDKPQPTIEQLQALQPQFEILENNAKIKEQIVKLESKQPRALREFALGQFGAEFRLKAIDDEISQLRTQLQE